MTRSRKNAKNRPTGTAQRSGNGTILVAGLLITIVAIAIWSHRDVANATPVATDAQPAQREPIRTGSDEEIFLNLIRTHPSKAVRDIMPLLQDGTISFGTSYTIPTTGQVMSVREAAYIHEAKRFIFGSEFLHTQELPLCYLQITLRHEVQHLQDDLAGMPMAPLVLQAKSDDEMLEVAKEIAHGEWRAANAEQELKGMIDCPQDTLWNADAVTRCEKFRHMLLTDDQHLPRAALEQHPLAMEWLQAMDCNAI